MPRPYPGQPVQGFSGTHRNADGSYLVMTDNGFGNKANSPDAELVVNRIKPDSDTGQTAHLGTEFVLSDPDHHVSWPIWRDGPCAAAQTLPTGYTCPSPDRVLTGWDFDPESMQVAPDGTFWFGDEFGPFLLHTDSTGRLLHAPIPTPGVKAPQNPALAAGETPNLASSRGYEGMAIKELLANLMAVPDPRSVGGPAAFFTFPFVTIEAVELVDEHTIAVMNDNNFPGTGGRSATRPDNNEYIEVSLDQPLRIDRRLLPQE